MDTCKNMIIAKGSVVTPSVQSCSFNQVTKRWDIVFKNGKTFHYAPINVVWLRSPNILKSSDYQIRYKGKILNDVTAIYSFINEKQGIEFWHICFKNNESLDVEKSELDTDKSCLSTKENASIFSYLKQVAQFISIKTDEDVPLLARQYEKINFLGEKNVLSAYINPDKYKSKSGVNSDSPIFPFGCNQSQFIAVKEALRNKISVIQGPPGTGKTQTILNIIANLVLQGKTVQVVSNNNSAVENIIEKLSSPKYNMDFLVALLGKSENKKHFIENQTGQYPDFSTWNCNFDKNFTKNLNHKSTELSRIFELQINLAKLKKEKYDVELEQNHYIENLQHIDIKQDRLFSFKKNISSQSIMEVLQKYNMLKEEEQNPSFWDFVKMLFRHHINIKKLSQYPTELIIYQLYTLFFDTKIKEINKEINNCETLLNACNAEKNLDNFAKESLIFFRSQIAKRYSNRQSRKIYTDKELFYQPQNFTINYPIVLSTTYASRCSLGKDMLFDYVIMDEASQVDIATGALALSCAKNAVIVGDTKQLPNVVTEEDKRTIGNLVKNNNIPQAYNFTTNSFLSSICAILGDKIPQTTLREHYRCHHQIIEFCNQKFYNGKLLIMSKNDSDNALQLVKTVSGNHARDRENQRQVDVIKNEILPNLNCPKNEIGIIAPYRDQVTKIKNEIAEPDIDVATVHKFQGREKDVIILSTVDDIATEFSDDPNLLNVAISRAKNKLIVVTSNSEQTLNSNIGDLIKYIQYNKCEIVQSKTNSVFDYLYGQYRTQRMNYLKRHKRISEYDSENLMYNLISEVLHEQNYDFLSTICHQPLNMLLRDLSLLTDEEAKFVNTGLSHLDFLIYNRVSKQAILAIEVDGFKYHQQNAKQAHRDSLKNSILQKYNLPLIRFSTTGSGEKEKLILSLKNIINN